MDERRIQVDWSFALKWLVVVAMGGTAGALLATVLAWRVGETTENILGETAAMLITGSLYGAILALGIGVGSGVLLQKRGISVGHWTAATMLAGGVGMAIAFTFAMRFPSADTMSELAAGLLMGLLLGLPIGIGQSLILRRHQFRANEWYIATALAAIIALGVGVPLGAEGRELLAVGTMALLFAAITGLGMTWLLRQEATAAI